MDPDSYQAFQVNPDPNPDPDPGEYFLFIYFIPVKISSERYVLVQEQTEKHKTRPVAITW